MRLEGAGSGLAQVACSLLWEGLPSGGGHAAKANMLDFSSFPLVCGGWC